MDKAEIESDGIEPSDSTPSLHGQVRSASHCAALSGGQGDLPISPARGERVFAAGAARLAGLASVVLGWRPDEFWRATPAELSAVLGALVGEQVPVATIDDLARLKEMFPDGRD